MDRRPRYADCGQRHNLGVGEHMQNHINRPKVIHAEAKVIKKVDRATDLRYVEVEYSGEPF